MTWTMVVHSKDILLLYYPIQKDALSKLAMTWTINVFSCYLIYYWVLTYMYAANKIWENIFLSNQLQLAVNQRVARDEYFRVVSLNLFFTICINLIKVKSTFSSLHFQAISILLPKFYFYRFQSLFSKTRFILVPTVISVMEISYVADGMHCWNIKCLHGH